MMWELLIPVALWLQVVKCGVWVNNNGFLVYWTTNQGLVSVPDDIPYDIDIVRLFQNSLSNIDSFPFRPNLTELDLYENELEEFPNLTNLSESLEDLDLSKNKIAYVDPERLGGLASLRILNLMYNRLQSMPDILPTGETSLVQLSLGFNSLYEFPLLPNLGRKLITVGVNKNYIKRIGKEHMMALPNLTHLTADHNHVESMPDLSPVGSTVVSVSLYNCRIRQVSAEDLRPLENLIQLNVGANFLEEIPDFRQSPSKATLQNLFLNPNRISHIHLERLYGMPSFNYLFLSGNPFHTLPNWCRLTKLPIYVDFMTNALTCDRRLRWTMRAKSAGMFLWQEHLLYPCDTPETLQGVLWSGIQEGDLGDTGK